MNISKLKTAMTERNLTVEEAARVLHINPSSFYRKLCRANSFSVEQARSLASILQLSREEASDIFFS